MEEWFHVPWPLAQVSGASFEPLHTSKQIYPSVPEKIKGKKKVEHNHMHDVTNLNVYA